MLQYPRRQNNSLSKCNPWIHDTCGEITMKTNYISVLFVNGDRVVKLWIDFFG